MRTEAEIGADAQPDRRPFSNGSEFDIWAHRHCYECVHDNASTELFCPILTVALLGKWPAEWVRRTVEWRSERASGSYEVVDTCTEFEERRDGGGPGDGEPVPPPHPEIPGQVDMFEVFVEQGLAELEQPQEVSA